MRKLDTATNPSDLGTKSLTGKRVNTLMFLSGFTNGENDLGKAEFAAQRMRAQRSQHS